MGASFANPDATLANTGAVTGGADADDVLRDGSDSTFVALEPDEYLWVSFSNTESPAIPAGATIIKIETYVMAWPGFWGYGDVPIICETTLAGTGYSNIQSIVPVSYRTWSAAQVAGTANDPDTATAVVKHTGSGGALVVTGMVNLITWVAKPVVDVTLPTGTLTEDNMPTVEWANTLDATGGGQFIAEIKIFNDAQYLAGGFDPSTSTPVASGSFIGGTTEWDCDVLLPNDTYRAYVRVMQYPSFQYEIWSDWNYEGFVVNVPVPAVPTMTLTAQPAATPVGRVKIDLDDNAGAATTDQIQVQRLNNDTDEWEDIRTLLGGGIVDPASWPTTIYDYEGTPGVVESYRARAVHNYSTADAFSDWSSTGTVTLSDADWSLIHPTDPRLSVRVDLFSFEGYTREARQTVKQPLGRTDAVVLTDTRMDETGNLSFKLTDDADLAAVTAMANYAIPVLLRPAAGHHEPNRWVILGNETITRRIDGGHFAWRDGVYDWNKVSRPEGDLVVWT